MLAEIIGISSSALRRRCDALRLKPEENVNTRDLIEGGKEYVEIGGRLYTYHVVERMMPRGLTTLGRSVSPTFVEEVIQTGTQSQKLVDGVLRTAYTSGSVSVVTEDGGRIVVTVITQ